MAEIQALVNGRYGQDENSKQEKPRLSIRQLRQAAQKENLAKEAAKDAQGVQQPRMGASQATQKKKSSLLGGLFQVREPTQIALNQVAAQMIAQHGSTSATKVPNVRLEKMPDFVPKVNSRWDGIPETVKQKENKDRQRSQRESFFSTDSMSRSEDGKRGRRTLSRNSSSTTACSFGAYGNSSGSQGASSQTRFYAHSVNSSGDLASQQRTDDVPFEDSVISPSVVSLKERVLENPSNLQRGPRSPGMDQYQRAWSGHDVQPQRSFTLDQAPAYRTKATSPKATPGSPPLQSPATDRSVNSQTRAISSMSVSTSEAALFTSIDSTNSARVFSTPDAEIMSANSSLRTQSFKTASPMTPFHFEQGSYGTDNPSGHVALSPSDNGVLGPRAAHGKQLPADADYPFLAGEFQELILPDDSSIRYGWSPAESDYAASQRMADIRKARMHQDLEKRPDSSRDRLGLRASMLLADMSPWEEQESKQGSPQSPRVAHAPNSRTKFHKPFGIIDG